MAKFEDKYGRVWSVRFTPAVIADLRRLLGLPHPMQPKFWERVCDPATMADATYVVCRAEAEARGVTDEQFGAALVSPSVVKAASTALIVASIQLAGKRR